jgi:putative solute:sodium symporter small subunit
VWRQPSTEKRGPVAGCPLGLGGVRDVPERVLLMEVDRMELTDKHRRYWRKNLNITAILLAIWFVVTFVVSYFARELSFNFFGWPFSFWMGAQGALVVYCVIIGYYAWYMNKLDIEHGVEETEE